MINVKKIRSNIFENMIEEPEVGENIIIKVRRIIDENEPLEDGAPLIYTPKADGVRPEHDIRTDKWKIAMKAMDKVNEYKVSKYLQDGEVKPVEEQGKITEPEQGKENPTTDN